MANYSAIKSVHKTLVAATVDQVTITGPSDEIEIVNFGPADITLLIGIGTAPANPVIGADDTDVIPPNTWKTYSNRSADDFIVKLISASATRYSVGG